MEPFAPGTNPAGVVTALCITVRTLIEHHPNPTMLMGALHEAHEKTLATLLAWPSKDGELQSYEAALRLLGLSPDAPPPGAVPPD